MGWGWPREPLLPRAGGRLTRPEGGRLPVLVVVGEAREARHAARVVALQALQQLPQFLLALLLPQQPHLVLLLQPLPTARGATALTPPSAPPWSLLGVPDPAPLLFLPRELWAQRRRVPKREGPLPKPHCRSKTAQRGRELGGCWDACSPLHSLWPPSRPPAGCSDPRQPQGGAGDLSDDLGVRPLQGLPWTSPGQGWDVSFWFALAEGGTAF